MTMNIISNLTSAARASLAYITAGALIIVWSSLYYVYLYNHPSPDGTVAPFYLCTGLLLTGITLLAIGLGIGWIGRAARPADQTHAVVNSQDNFGNPTQDIVQLPTNAVTINPAIPPPAAVQPAFVPPQAPAPNVVSN
jgi:hypothetical protein